MLNADRMYMLAADHRWQWEEWCDARGIARDRIAEIKRLALEGFLLARERSSDVRDFGALLLDGQYGESAIADAMRAGLTVGTPAEKAGAFPLAWAADPFSRALSGAFVKVLVRYRPDDDAAGREEQWRKLDALQSWCREARKPLVVEVLVARRGEDAEAFETSGRPAIIAAFVADAYRRNLTPAFWKIEGTLAADGARTIDAAVAAHPGGRQILLGKAADLSTIDRWFAAAASSRTAAGFAIGRSVFWDPSAAYLSGEQGADAAAAAICANYLGLVDAWRRARATLG
jgi:5-dehydro-2-deoxygluconokinase